MKSRKLNHYVDIFCKKFLGWNNYLSIETFRTNGSGKYSMNFLDRIYSFEKHPIVKFEVALEIQTWFDAKIIQDKFDLSDFERAELQVEAKVPKDFKDPSEIQFSCFSQITYKSKTFEKSFIDANTAEIIR